MGPRQLGRVMSLRLSFLLRGIGTRMIPALWSCRENYVHKRPVSGVRPVAPSMASGHGPVAAAAPAQGEAAEWKVEACHLTPSSNVPCRTPSSLLLSPDGDSCDDRHRPGLCVELACGINAETGTARGLRRVSLYSEAWSSSLSRVFRPLVGLSGKAVPFQPCSKDAQSPRCDGLPHLSVSYTARKGCPQV